MMNPKDLIEKVEKGANPDLLIANIGITEAGPADAKMFAKELASKFGGVVSGSRMGWGTDVVKISKGKAHNVINYLKEMGFEDVSHESVYKQLIAHLGSKAWVLANKKRGVTIRVADTDQIMTPQGKMQDIKDLLVNVLYD